MAEAAEPRGGLRQGAYHSVGLGKPCIRHYQDSHAADKVSPGCDDEMNEGAVFRDKFGKSTIS
jgi:hypothetical protein